ncbi:hypothetical protein CH252_35620 [Rhodococcus sp. 06-1477-1B]|nr:hypothetical protein CH252_35620 [Rhodococcus sp. 06-1477-1B]
MSGAGHLGITIGNTRSVAVYRDSTAFEPTVVVLPTTLRFDDDGRAHLGESVDTAPFTRFVDLVGKQEDLEPDADAYRAEDLMANAANCLVSMFSETSESASTPVTTMTYPTRWPRENIALLRDALDHTGLTDVALVPEAKAASAFAQPSPGAAVTVIDIGATGTDISTYPGGGTERSTAVGGDVFTDALFDHVVTDREHLDLSDSAVLASLTGVVASCEQAKHTLSTADVATIAVELPGVSDTTTVTRAEFADLIAPTLGLLDVPSTGTVVLTGGSAALPSVVADIGERTAGALLVEPLAAFLLVLGRRTGERGCGVLLGRRVGTVGISGRNDGLRAQLGRAEHRCHRRYRLGEREGRRRSDHRDRVGVERVRAVVASDHRRCAGHQRVAVDVLDLGDVQCAASRSERLDEQRACGALADVGDHRR